VQPDQNASPYLACVASHRGCRFARRIVYEREIIVGIAHAFAQTPTTLLASQHDANASYFQQDETGRRLEDVLALGDPDMYSAGNPVQATTTTLNELQVFPQPVQKPHPQLWEPLTSTRSLKFAAEHGINGVMIAEPNDRLRRNIEIYYEAAEKAVSPTCTIAVGSSLVGTATSAAGS
jgi:alkanesulfonate monooxygenase SsuD/methylene tetrahydromethanopterin reductase-like flavin-dependent oxidoreductase (luciferase family)